MNKDFNNLWLKVVVLNMLEFALIYFGIIFIMVYCFHAINSKDMALMTMAEHSVVLVSLLLGSSKQLVLLIKSKLSFLIVAGMLISIVRLLIVEKYPLMAMYINMSIGILCFHLANTGWEELINACVSGTERTTFMNHIWAARSIGTIISAGFAYIYANTPLEIITKILIGFAILVCLMEFYEYRTYINYLRRNKS